jgi:hypothetical protein
MATDKGPARTAVELVNKDRLFMGSLFSAPEYIPFAPIVFPRLIAIAAISHAAPPPLAGIRTVQKAANRSQHLRIEGPNRVNQR